MKAQKLREAGSAEIIEAPVTFRPHLRMGLALSKIGNDLVRLPSGRSLREARFNVLGIGPLHNFLRNCFAVELYRIARNPPRPS